MEKEDAKIFNEELDQIRHSNNFDERKGVI
jgi:hypothetical protein